MAFNFEDSLEEANKQYGYGDKADTEWFKIKEGENRIRIMSEGAIIASHFMGKGVKPKTCYGEGNGCPVKDGETGKHTQPGVKWLFWIMDRSEKNQEHPTGVLKMAQLSYVICQAVGALQKSEDYSFTDMPMPYDITINAKGAGTKEVTYTVIPSPKIIPATEEELAALAKQNSPAEVVKAMKNKQAKLDGNIPETEQADTVKIQEGIEYPNEVNPEDIPF